MNYPTSHADMAFHPRRSQCQATWAPLFIEPVVGSGERLCIGVAVANQNEFLVVPVAALDRLACLYGQEAGAILFASELATKTLTEHLARGGPASLADWLPPVEGIFMGQPRPGAGESISDVARTALMQSASLVEKLADEEETAESSERAGLSSNRLEKLVREEVMTKRPDFRELFGRRFRVAENARATRIGFTGNRLVANFGLLVPGQLSGLVSVAKAKLWDLGQLRNGALNSLLPDHGHEFELLLHRIKREDPQYSDRQVASVEEAVNELEEEADKVSIRCRPLTSPGEIAAHLLEREAA